MPDSTLQLRPAHLDDAADLARLSGELGYPASAAQLRQRLATLLAAPQQHFVCIAQWQGETCGWIHGFVRPLLESDTCVELGGLVVAATQRGHGIGSALLAACEQWAKTQGIHQLGLRSAEHRQDAHRFYRQHGYVHVKTSLTLRKTLASDGAPH